MQTRTVLVFRLLFVGAVLGVTVLSVVPTPQIDGLESDKMGHFIAYAVLALLLVPSVSADGRMHKGLGAGLPLLFLYGVLIEVLQHYIGRQFDFRDMAANAIGVLVGAGVGLATRFLIRRRQTR